MKKIIYSCLFFVSFSAFAEMETLKRGVEAMAKDKEAQEKAANNQLSENVAPETLSLATQIFPAIRGQQIQNIGALLTTIQRTQAQQTPQGGVGSNAFGGNQPQQSPRASGPTTTWGGTIK